jgi:alpha-1,2-mannosyltransferase
MNQERLSDEPRAARAATLAPVALGLWLLAMAAILIHAGLKPNSGSVCKVFRAGGSRWLAGQELYPKVGEFLYSPFAAAFFAPLALLPAGLSDTLWRLLGLAAYTGGFAAWIGKGRPAPRERVALAWLLLLPLSLGDFYNGQANPLVIGLLMLAIVACSRTSWMAAAFCVAVPVYFKVYPVAIGLLLAALRPRFSWRLALTLAAFFGFSLLLQRPGYALEQYGSWIHSLGQDPRRTLNYFGTDRDFWLVLRVLRVPVSVRGWTILQALSGMALAAYLLMAQRRGVLPEKLDFLLLSLGACWMLLFGPETESATYLVLAPPLALAWLRWSGEPGARPFLRAAWACYAFLIGSQMLSSWGHQYQTPYTHLAQPIGTMIFASALLIYGWIGEARAA